MNFQVSRSREALKVIAVVIQRIKIAVMNDTSPGHRSEMRFPNKYRTSLPRSRFSRLDVGSHRALFVRSNPNRANGNLAIRFAALLELGTGRKVNPPFASIPCLTAGLEGVGGRQPRPSLIAFHGRADNGRQSVLSVPDPATLERTKPGSLSPVGFHLENAAADFACFCNHAWIVPRCRVNVNGNTHNRDSEPKYFDIAVKRITDELQRFPLFREPTIQQQKFVL